MLVIAREVGVDSAAPRESEQGVVAAGLGRSTADAAPSATQAARLHEREVKG